MDGYLTVYFGKSSPGWKLSKFDPRGCVGGITSSKGNVLLTWDRLLYEISYLVGKDICVFWYNANADAYQEICSQDDYDAFLCCSSSLLVTPTPYPRPQPAVPDIGDVLRFEDVIMPHLMAFWNGGTANMRPKQSLFSRLSGNGSIRRQPRPQLQVPPSSTRGRRSNNTNTQSGDGNDVTTADGYAAEEGTGYADENVEQRMENPNEYMDEMNGDNDVSDVETTSYVDAAVQCTDLPFASGVSQSITPKQEGGISKPEFDHSETEIHDPTAVKTQSSMGVFQRQSSGMEDAITVIASPPTRAASSTSPVPRSSGRNSGASTRSTSRVVRRTTATTSPNPTTPGISSNGDAVSACGTAEGAGTFRLGIDPFALVPPPLDNRVPLQDPATAGSLWKELGLPKPAAAKHLAQSAQLAPSVCASALDLIATVASTASASPRLGDAESNEGRSEGTCFDETGGDTPVSALLEPQPCKTTPGTHKHTLTAQTTSRNVILLPSNTTAVATTPRSTPYRGVSFNQRSRAYKATVTVDSKQVWVSVFAHPGNAARAFDTSAWCFRGANEKFNFPCVYLPYTAITCRGDPPRFLRSIRPATGGGLNDNTGGNGLSTRQYVGVIQLRSAAAGQSQTTASTPAPASTAAPSPNTAAVTPAGKRKGRRPVSSTSAMDADMFDYGDGEQLTNANSVPVGPVCEPGDEIFDVQPPHGIPSEGGDILPRFELPLSSPLFAAIIPWLGQPMLIGTFPTAFEAARAYDRVAFCLVRGHVEYTRLNFPDQLEDHRIVLRYVTLIEDAERNCGIQPPPVTLGTLNQRWRELLSQFFLHGEYVPQSFIRTRVRAVRMSNPTACQLATNYDKPGIENTTEPMFMGTHTDAYSIVAPSGDGPVTVPLLLPNSTCLYKYVRATPGFEPRGPWGSTAEGIMPAARDIRALSLDAAVKAFAHYVGGPSYFRGVSFNPALMSYTARVTVGDKVIACGTFSSQIIAAIHHDRILRRLKGMTGYASGNADVNSSENDFTVNFTDSGVAGDGKHDDFYGCSPAQRARLVTLFSEANHVRRTGTANTGETQQQLVDVLQVSLRRDRFTIAPANVNATTAGAATQPSAMQLPQKPMSSIFAQPNNNVTYARKI